MLILVFLLAIFLFSLVSLKTPRVGLTPPIVFTVVGLVTAAILNELPAVDHNNGESFLAIAELGLVLLLFADANHCDLRLLRDIKALPTRLLTVGMLLTIGLGLLVAMVLFDQLTMWEAGILAAVLAPTDAGLGAVIVTDKRLPLRIREALNVEAGLNDGLAVPFLLFFIALAGPAGDHDASLVGFIVEQIGYGALIGFGLGRGGGMLAMFARHRGWMSKNFDKMALLAIPLLCLLIAQAVDGSAFIAAFVAGLALPRRDQRATEVGVELIEDWGQFINLAVFYLFGVLFAACWSDLRPVHFLYGVLSLTIIRMLPVAIAMIGSGLSLATVGFLGWFGPRGLASIVLGLVYYEHAIGHTENTIGLAVTATVLLSILAHGFTATPGAERYAAHIKKMPADALERET